MKILITNKKYWPIYNSRSIKLGKELYYNDTQNSIGNFKQKELIYKFVPIHMASQGYWKIQDEEEK